MAELAQQSDDTSKTEKLKTKEIRKLQERYAEVSAELERMKQV